MGINPDGDAVDGRHAAWAQACTAPFPSSSPTTTSFLRQLQAILEVRSHYGIATSRQVDIPEVSHRGMLVLVHQLDGDGRLQLTVLNFANEHIAGTRAIGAPAARGGGVGHVHRQRRSATVDDLHSFAVDMPQLHGMSLLVEVPAAPE